MISLISSSRLFWGGNLSSPAMLCKISASFLMASTGVSTWRKALQQTSSVEKKPLADMVPMSHPGSLRKGILTNGFNI